MGTTYQISVFGKKGCDKCAVLKDRISKMLEKEELKDFSMKYWDVETEEGMVMFCQTECLNPQRIPAMLVMKENGSGDYEPIPNPKMGTKDEVCGKSRLYQYLGIQTDYSDEGKGVITPRMIKSVLDEARV